MYAIPVCKNREYTERGKGNIKKLYSKMSWSSCQSVFLTDRLWLDIILHNCSLMSTPAILMLYMSHIMNTFIQLIHRLFISASSCHRDLVKTWTVRDFMMVMRQIYDCFCHFPDFQIIRHFQTRKYCLPDKNVKFTKLFWYMAY